MFFSCGDYPRATLGHVGHVPIRVDATFIFVPLFYFGGMSPDAPLESFFYLGLVSAGLFVSILLHEIGHGIAAHRNRMGVDELVVGGFYGYAALRGIAPTRRAKSSPKLVRRIWRALRSNRAVPSVSSNSLICMDKAGCDIAQDSAARPKCPWRARVWK